MTAPRACRSCGADLAPDVRSSRWKRAGPLSFGPVGRVVMTALVLLMGPWATVSFFTIMYTPIWLGLSFVVLKQVWHRESLDEDAPPTATERFRERHPILGHRFDGSSVAIVLGALLLATVSVLMIRADTVGFYGLVALLAMLGLGAFIAWVADV